MLHLDTTGPETPRLPERGLSAGRQTAASALAHLLGALVVVVAGGHPALNLADGRTTEEPCLEEMSHVVFMAPDPRPTGGGGGGGGNQSDAPIRRAEGHGRDAITLRTTPKAVAPVARIEPAFEDVPPVPAITVEATPLASGTVEQLGLPSTGVPTGTSLGSGTGGGVGTGAGGGIGPGRGAGLGQGTGGGTGGGVFRAGGIVSSPRVITEVRPKYTSSALLRHVQGTVELELVVTRDGRPSQIRITRSLDPGLDEEAIAAVTQWRFEPGRMSGTPVDVLVVVLLDFWIR